jgi:hypothetical protein
MKRRFRGREKAVRNTKIYLMKQKPSYLAQSFGAKPRR